MIKLLQEFEVLEDSGQRNTAKAKGSGRERVGTRVRKI